MALIKGMRARGDHQQHIATWFAVNQGRVNEVLCRDAGRYLHIAPALDLPPPGPYVVVPRAEFSRVSEAAAVPLRILEEIDRKLNQLLREAPHDATARQVQVAHD